MNIYIIIIIFIAVITVILLSSCILYLVYVYRLLLEKYSNLTLKTDRDETTKKIKLEVNSYVNGKIDDAISSATSEAVEIIAKNAKNIATSMRSKTIERLKAEETGQERAVAIEYDKVNAEIENFKKSEFERIRKNANEILINKLPEIITDSITPEKQDELILKALENAKRSKIF